MTEQPITPTRIIPAGQPVPTAPPLPAAPHGAEDLPPWRTAAPSPGSPPPADPPPPAREPFGEQRVVVEVWYPPADAQPDPDPGPRVRFSLDWLWQRAHPWRSFIGGALVLLPIPGVHYGAATVWASTVHQARDAFGIWWGYGLAFGVLGLAAAADERRTRWWTRGLLVVGFIGCFGAIDWFDPITIMTGVQR